MKLYKNLAIFGVAVTIVGLLMLTFQATLYLAFGEWYGFTVLDIMVRIGLRDRLYTGVDGFDDTADLLLDHSLPLAMIIVGGTTAAICFRLWQREKEWYRPE